MHPNIGKYKPDWQEARGRMIVWWNGKETDRVILNVGCEDEQTARDVLRELEAIGS
jgi:hypothetical protein